MKRDAEKTTRKSKSDWLSNLLTATMGTLLIAIPASMSAQPSTPPSLDMQYPTTNVVIPDTQSTYLFQGSALDPEGLLDAVEYRVGLETDFVTFGSWSNATNLNGNWTSWEFEATGLQQGTNVVEVRARDNDNLESAAAVRRIMRESVVARGVGLLCLTPGSEVWGSTNVGGVLGDPSNYGTTSYSHDTSTGYQTVAGYFNADTLLDLLMVTDLGEAWMQFNTGTGGFTANFHTADGYLYQDNGWSVIPGDYNGDGLTDLVQTNEFGDVWVGHNVDGVIPEPTLIGNVQIFNLPELGYWAGAGDMNGDGKDDLVSLHPNSTTFVATATETGYNNLSAWGNHSFLYDRSDASAPTASYGIVLGDFNGDGKDDMACITPAADAYISLSNGTNLQTPTKWKVLGFYSAPHFGNGWEVFAGDVDNDGKDDLIQITSNGEAWWAKSTGSSFANPVLLKQLGFHHTPTGPWQVYVGKINN